MAAMTSRFNIRCMIQYYSDQWLKSITSDHSLPVHWQDVFVRREGRVKIVTGGCSLLKKIDSKITKVNEQKDI